MNPGDIPDRWARMFGLALAPLFEDNETTVAGSHHVLLDGGHGSFALSVVNEPIWKDRIPASWSWSSNLPHHVTVTKDEVVVVRWDKAAPEHLTRRSVESKIDAFYAYLSADRVRSSQRVVDHMLTIFRRVRSLVADAHLGDEKSTDAYLAFLAYAIDQTRAPVLQKQLASSAVFDGEVLKSLSVLGVEALFEELSNSTLNSLALNLTPALAVRHAGSEIFQEAHFELLRAPRPDLFGYTGPAEAKPTTRGGAHFTPPALARSIAEQTVKQLGNLKLREKLTILDPACGSGAFLHEGLRVLRRMSFNGSLKIIGRDTSAPAISMAKFVLNSAVADWSPKGGCEIDLVQADSLAVSLPQADIILMNPPFIAWSALTSTQRQQMHDVLGDALQGRGDFSMAFVTHAVKSLASGGAIGTLFPASLLTLQAAEDWRSDLLDKTNLRFVASIGDYSLFAYALIQVAAAVFQSKDTSVPMDDGVTALVTANDPETTGNAFRVLRQEGQSNSTVQSDSWQLFRTSSTVLRSRPTWRLTSPRTETALQRLVDVGGAVPIGSLFDVRQGVRTGMNSAFLISNADAEQLPKRERQWLRPAIMNESIANGVIDSNYQIFYPYTRGGLAIETEEQLLKMVPIFAERFLLKAKARLKTRANITRANRSDWWGLSERRSWALDPQPRIISKYFGGPGGFSLDAKAAYIVVQGFAWFAKLPASDAREIEQQQSVVTSEVLMAYSAMMNSSRFARLLEIFSPHVAGGQFDLSARYVDAIPVPNLFLLAQDERAAQAIRALEQLGRTPRVGETDWDSAADRLTTELYGGGILEFI